MLLVAYGTGPMSDAQLHLACRSANDSGATVRVIHIVERSRHVPLSTPLSREEEARAHELLDHAEEIIHRYGVASALEIVRAPSVGEAIVANAVEHRARAIFIGLRDRHRPGTARFLSATLRHVLHHAPCPVQIGYLPASLPDDFADRH